MNRDYMERNAIKGVLVVLWYYTILFGLLAIVWLLGL